MSKKGGLGQFADLVRKRGVVFLWGVTHNFDINFDIKQKNCMEYLFYYIPKTPNKKWVNANKVQSIPVTT